MAKRVSGQQQALARSRLQDDLIVTGEAVALEARPASVGVRTLGAALDAVVIVAAAILVLLASTPLLERLNQAQMGVIQIVTIATIMVGSPVVIETLTRGLSLGKLACGVRVVRDDGGPIRFRHALVRALVGVGEIWLSFGFLAFVSGVLSRRSKRLGDILAGTYSVRVRGAERSLPPLVSPPELAGWARTADIRSLPDGLGLAGRQFLARTSSMDPEARERMGRELAAQIEPRVSPAPPWGTHPERFLAAVLVERRDREYVARLRAQERADADAAEIAKLPFGVGR